MIGESLQEEENTADENFHYKILQTDEKQSAVTQTLPLQDNDLTLSENLSDKSFSAGTQENIEMIPLPEDRQTARNVQTAALIPANTETLVKTELPAEDAAENLRRTGLAWSAATVLGGSVIFMLVIGWFFDLVFGSKPWGVVGGIVIGAIIGFIQFFRITSQIFKKSEVNSISSNDDTK